MIKRTIELSNEPAHLCASQGQLLVQRRGEARGAVPTQRRIPMEDLGFLILDERQSTCSVAALGELAAHGTAVIVCGAQHLPVGILLPLPEHSETVWRIGAQVGMGTVLRKQIWARIVSAKIRAQAQNLPSQAVAHTKLLQMARRVRSGDAGNAEALAARVYWGAWLPIGREGDRFRRVPGGGAPPNNLLDYGYTVMRAAVARALVGAGLVTAIGIKHSNRSNAFALADDLVEPLRPAVDAVARELFLAGRTELDREGKARLLGLLVVPARRGRGGEEGPLMVVLHSYAASFVRALDGVPDALEIPVPVLTGQSEGGPKGAPPGGSPDLNDDEP